MSQIALLTDFGSSDWFVGAMKGVILGINPRVNMADITHGIPAGSVRSGAFALQQSYTYFPVGTVFLAVVDPGVGGDRKPIAVKTRDYFFVAPDNGLLSFALKEQGPFQARVIENTKYFRSQVSSTFHGRDIFAPAAAHLSKRTTFSSLGPACRDLVSLEWPESKMSSGRVSGEVVYIDRFGNLITNLSSRDMASLKSEKLRAGMKGRKFPFCSYYAQVPQGSLLAVLGSCGLVEISVNGGHAAQTLKANVGDKVVLYAS